MSVAASAFGLKLKAAQTKDTTACNDAEGPVGTAFGAVDAAVTAINHAIKNARLPSFTA